MATLNSLTLDVFDLLWGVGQIRRPVRDTLATNVDDGTDVEWQFTTDTMWKRGDLAEYWPGTGAEGEIIYHTEDHPSGADTTVIRAQNQTTAVAGGFTAGDEFLKNNPYPAVLIRRFINEVIDTDLAPHVWYRSERTITWDTTVGYYSLNASDFDVEQMYQVDLDGNTNLHPLPSGWWEVINNLNTGVMASGRAVRVKRVYSTTDTLYYTARTHPASSAISSLPDGIAAMVPWATVARVLASQAGGQRIDPTRQAAGNQTQPAQPFQDHNFFQQRFEQMRRNYRLKLLREQYPQKRYRNSRVWRG